MGWSTSLYVAQIRDDSRDALYAGLVKTTLVLRTILLAAMEVPGTNFNS
jgi:hypothetical protein